MKERIIMLSIDKFSFIHKSKNMRFYTVKDLLIDENIVIHGITDILYKRRSPSKIHIFKCSLFQKENGENNVFCGMDVYFKLKTPCKSVIQKIKQEYAELFI